MDERYIGPLVFLLSIAFGFGMVWAIYRVGFLCRWYLLGWRPYIYDFDTITKVVGECLAEAVLKEVKDAEESGQPLTEEQKASRILQLQPMLHKVIDRYIIAFGKDLPV